MSLDYFLYGFDEVLKEVLTAMSPILVLFLLFLLIFKLPKKMLLTLFQGVIFAFLGLTLFLQGVHVGFLPVGNEMGSIIGGMSNRWILIPLGFILGFVATLAEPAVRILCNQVEKTSSGTIRSNLILFTLCLAVGIIIALGMTRVVYGIPFYYIIIPGYLFAIILMIFSKPSFTAIAFDSGGVATGPMTVTFIMAMAVGAADIMEGRDAVVDGFGLIALVALAPIIMVMLLGFLFPDDAEVEDEDSEVDVEEMIKKTCGARDEPWSPDPPEESEQKETGQEELKLENPEADREPDSTNDNGEAPDDDVNSKS
ncbi:MAG: DUF1538 domain-containing protein [Bacillota bacterium]